MGGTMALLGVLQSFYDRKARPKNVHKIRISETTDPRGTCFKM